MTFWKVYGLDSGQGVAMVNRFVGRCYEKEKTLQRLGPAPEPTRDNLCVSGRPTKSYKTRETP